MAYTKRHPPNRGFLMKGDVTSHEPLHYVVVHQFRVSDVEDPLVYASEPLYKWEQSDAGKWVKEHAIDIVWHSQLNSSFYGTDFAVVATLKETDYAWFLLKYQ